jgi:predicted nucleic acid-binding protein
LSVYLDASVIVPTLVQSPPTAAVHAFMNASNDEFLVSDFAAAEVASALSRLVRMQELDRADAHQRLATFDGWLALDATCIDVEPPDIREAAAIVRRFELMLRTPDALHVAICARLSASLVTRDGRLASAATSVGVAAILP